MATRHVAPVPAFGVPDALVIDKSKLEFPQDWSPLLSGEGAPRKASFSAPFALAPNAKVLHGRRGLEGTAWGKR